MSKRNIVPNSNFYRRSRMDLVLTDHTMSGVVSYEDDATGEYVTTPFSIAFDIEANTPTTIELCPDPTAIAAAPADSAPPRQQPATPRRTPHQRHRSLGPSISSK